MLSLGQAIRKLRKAKGLSQRELATRLEVDPTYVSHLESDRRDPSLQLLRSIATQLELPPGVLLALLVWTDLPPGQLQAYRGLVEKLLDLAGANQMRMQLDDPI